MAKTGCRVVMHMLARQVLLTGYVIYISLMYALVSSMLASRLTEEQLLGLCKIYLANKMVCLIYG